MSRIRQTPCTLAGAANSAYIAFKRLARILDGCEGFAACGSGSDGVRKTTKRTRRCGRLAPAGEVRQVMYRTPDFKRPKRAAGLRVTTLIAVWCSLGALRQSVNFL